MKNVFDTYSMPLLFSSLCLRMGSLIRRDHGQEKKGKKEKKSKKARHGTILWPRGRLMAGMYLLSGRVWLVVWFFTPTFASPMKP
jgi:hypothetical protein